MEADGLVDRAVEQVDEGVRLQPLCIAYAPRERVRLDEPVVPLGDRRALPARRAPRLEVLVKAHRLPQTVALDVLQRRRVRVRRLNESWDPHRAHKATDPPHPIVSQLRPVQLRHAPRVPPFRRPVVDLRHLRIRADDDRLGVRVEPVVGEREVAAFTEEEEHP